MPLAIFYGSNNGNTAQLAQMIQQELTALGCSVYGVYNIRETPLEYMQHFNQIILGSPTWNTGELQDDWDVNFGKLSGIDFAGKYVAFFGSGDAVGYASTFQDAMGTIYQKVVGEKGGQNVGWWPATGYNSQGSKANVNGYFVGLAIDENQSDQTPARVKAWCAQIAPYMTGA